MENKNLIQRRNRFLKSIIGFMQMDVNEFIQNLADGEHYETTIYSWAIHLFNEGKSIEDAIECISQMRRSMLLERNLEFNVETSIIANRRRVMNKLKLIPIYSQQTEKQKVMLQYKIDKLLQTNLYSYQSVIDQIIKIIRLANQSNGLSKPSTQPTLLKAS